MGQKVTNVRISPMYATVEVLVCSHTVEIRQVQKEGALSVPIITIDPKTGAVHVFRDQPYDVKIFHGDLDILEGSE